MVLTSIITPYTSQWLDCLRCDGCLCKFAVICYSYVVQGVGLVKHLAARPPPPRGAACTREWALRRCPRGTAASARRRCTGSGRGCTRAADPSPGTRREGSPPIEQETVLYTSSNCRVRVHARTETHNEDARALRPGVCANCASGIWLWYNEPCPTAPHGVRIVRRPQSNWSPERYRYLAASFTICALHERTELN